MPKSPKTSILNLRMAPEEMEVINQTLKRLGLNTPRKRSAYLRYRLLHEELQPIIDDATRQGLIQAFADMVRVGGLLNQVAHHINRRYIELVNLDQDGIEVDASRLYKILKDLEQKQQTVKKEIIELNRRGRHG